MRRLSPRPTPIFPAGLTLVEVLMSMMVAGIGLLSVIVLLPLSFVRAVQATNLTNGTILRYNAESQIKQLFFTPTETGTPSMLSPWQGGQQYQLNDAVAVTNLPQIWMKCTTAGTSAVSATPPATWGPNPAPTITIGPPPSTTADGTVSWTAQDYNSLNLAYVFPTWTPSTTYSIGAVVLAPTGSNGNSRRFLCVAPTATTGGVSSAAPPPWNTSLVPAPQTTTDGTVTWQTVDHSHYVIDPVGWNAMNSVSNTAASPPAPPTLAGALGNNAAGLGVNDVANGAAIERFPAGIRTGLPDALRFAMLPDSWLEAARGPIQNPQPPPAGANPPAYTSVDLANFDLTNLTLPPQGVSRIVLIDATGKLSQTRLVSSYVVAAGPITTVSWSISDALTGGFVPAFARVESQEARYTWMLTVQRSSGGGSASVWVTIFFNRALTAPDEQVYAANGNDGVFTPFTVTYPAGQKPNVKKGSFMFDVTDGRWYRITDIVSDTGTVLSLLVDQTRPLADTQNGPNFNVVFMRGVVDVFPIGNE
jgi:Tfp pilus assembly protein PilV